MAPQKKRTPRDSLPLRNFDLRKRYDIYYYQAGGLAVCRNVLFKSKRTFEPIASPQRPFIEYLELEDSKGRTFMLQYLHISVICEAGVKPPFSTVRK